MKKTIKKIAASVMAATVLAVGMTSVGANAVYKSTQFMKDAGSPGGASSTSVTWYYTTYSSTSTVKVSNFTATNSNTSIFAYIEVERVKKASGRIYPSGGSVTATGLEDGKSAVAYAKVNYEGGNVRAFVELNG